MTLSVATYAAPLTVVPATFFQPPKVYPVLDNVEPLFKVIPVVPVVYVASATLPVPPFTLYETEYCTPVHNAYKVLV